MSADEEANVSERVGTPSSAPLALEQPPDEAPPAPTAWPASVALGLTTMAAGLVAETSVWTSQVRLAFFLFGAAFFLLGLGGWIKDLRDEGRQGE